jgi:folate-binding protein YgfZ
MGEAPKAATLHDRAVLAMTGADRVKFLQGLVTNDVRKLTPQNPLYAGVLNGHGKLACDLFLIEDGDRILIDVAASCADDLMRRFARFKLSAQVEFGLAEPVLGVAVVWGDGVGETEAAICAQPRPGWHVFADPRLAALGVRLIHPADVAVEAELRTFGAVATGSEAYAGWRLAMGVAEAVEVGQEAFFALEANLEDLHGVDFKKGCYVGQELTARMHLKNALRQRLLPVSSPQILPAPGAPVTSADGVELGALVHSSGARGLAMLRLDRLEAAQEGELLAGQTPLSVQWPAWLAR